MSLPVPLGERSLPGGPILLVALILALCGYGTWYYLSTDERARPERVAAVPADLRMPNVQVPAAPQVTPKAALPPGPDADAPTSSKPSPALAPGPDLRPSETAADTPPPVMAANPPPVAAAALSSTNRPNGAGAPDPIVFPGSPPAQTAAVAPPAAAPQPAAPTLPSPAATPAAPNLSPAAAPLSAMPASAAGGASGDARVAIRALADCWIQVRASDQSVIFSRVLKAGETYHVPGRTGLWLRTGNAGALGIEVDGKPAPSLGPIGTLRRNVALDPDALVAGTAVHG